MSGSYTYHGLGFPPESSPYSYDNNGSSSSSSSSRRHSSNGNIAPYSYYGQSNRVSSFNSNAATDAAYEQDNYAYSSSSSAVAYHMRSPNTISTSAPGLTQSVGMGFVDLLKKMKQSLPKAVDFHLPADWIVDDMSAEDRSYYLRVVGLYEELLASYAKKDSYFVAISDLLNSPAVNNNVNALLGFMKYVRIVLLSDSMRKIRFSVELVDFLIKNCNYRIHLCIGQSRFMKTISLVGRRQQETPGREHSELADFIFDCIQAWGEAFMERRQIYPHIWDVYFKLRSKYNVVFSRPDFDPSRVPIFLDFVSQNERDLSYRLKTVEDISSAADNSTTACGGGSGRTLKNSLNKSLVVQEEDLLDIAAYGMELIPSSFNNTGNTYTAVNNSNNNINNNNKGGDMAAEGIKRQDQWGSGWSFDDSTTNSGQHKYNIYSNETIPTLQRKKYDAFGGYFVDDSAITSPSPVGNPYSNSSSHLGANNHSSSSIFDPTITRPYTLSPSASSATNNYNIFDCSNMGIGSSFFNPTFPPLPPSATSLQGQNIASSTLLMDPSRAYQGEGGGGGSPHDDVISVDNYSHQSSSFPCFAENVSINDWQPFYAPPKVPSPNNVVSFNNISSNNSNTSNSNNSAFALGNFNLKSSFKSPEVAVVDNKARSIECNEDNMKIAIISSLENELRAMTTSERQELEARENTNVHLSHSMSNYFNVGTYSNSNNGSNSSSNINPSPASRLVKGSGVDRSSHPINAAAGCTSRGGDLIDRTASYSNQGPPLQTSFLGGLTGSTGSSSSSTSSSIPPLAFPPLAVQPHSGGQTQQFPCFTDTATTDTPVISTATTSSSSSSSTNNLPMSQSPSKWARQSSTDPNVAIQFVGFQRVATRVDHMDK